MSEQNQLSRKLKEYRKAQHLTQMEFAHNIGMPYRTYQNYESGARYPKSMDVLEKMAVAMDTTTQELIGSAGGFIVGEGLSEHAIKKNFMQLASQISAMFFSDNIDETAKDDAMQALSDAYWKHKNDIQKLALAH